MYNVTSKKNSGGNMRINRPLVAVAFIAVGTVLFGADDTLNNLSAINSSVQSTVQQGIGGWMKFAIGWLPVIVAFAMGFGTMFHHIKKSEQSQENDYLKIGGYAFLFFFLGGVLGYAIDSMIGATLLGNATCGTEVFTTYWKESLGVVQPGSTYNCL